MVSLCWCCREALWDAERGYNGERVEGLDFFVEHLPWKKLPKEVFAAHGSFEQAKQLRKERGYGRQNSVAPASHLDIIAASADQEQDRSSAVPAQAAKKVSIAEPNVAVAAAGSEPQLVAPLSVITPPTIPLPSLSALKRRMLDKTTAAVEDMRRQLKVPRTSAEVLVSSTALEGYHIPHLHWNLNDKY